MKPKELQYSVASYSTKTVGCLSPEVNVKGMPHYSNGNATK